MEILVLFLLMAAVDIKQLLSTSEGKGIVGEKEREEILQRLKEQKESLRLLHLQVKKEIANLEVGQEAVTKPALALETKIQQCICKVFFLAAMALFKLWG